MPIWLLAFWGKWKPYIVIAVAAALLFGAWSLKMVSFGRQQGQDRQIQTDKESIRETHVAQQDDHAAKEAKLDSDLKEAAQAKNDARAEADRAHDERVRAQALHEGELNKARALPQDQVHAYNRGLMNPGKTPEPNACYAPAEERQIAEALTGYQGCKDENAKQAKETDSERKLRESAERNAALLQQLVDERGKRIDQLETTVFLLGNQKPIKYKSKWCLKLWQCGTKPFELPKRSAGATP